LVLGCGARVDRAEESSQPIVYGSDDRKEYFEVTDGAARLTMSESMVAITSKTWFSSIEGDGPRWPSWGDVEHLCPGEPFADQPVAAFCTGVLVDWDLVLTAGHCTRVFPVDDTIVVFDYFYRQPGELAATTVDTVDVVEIVAESLDPVGVEPRLDYAWLRLRAPVLPPRRPVPVFVTPPPLRLGDPIVSIGAGGGVPMKLDAGGRVRNVRESTRDYFVADVDSSHGSSGAGAFSSEFALLGILARGGADFVDTPEGCRATLRVNEDAATEQFTYAHQAVHGLCGRSPSASSLCRADCGEPCRALAPPELMASGGCVFAGRRRKLSGASSNGALLALAAMGALRNRFRFSGTRS
jgi:hypothetical protein